MELHDCETLTPVYLNDGFSGYGVRVSRLVVPGGFLYVAGRRASVPALTSAFVPDDGVTGRSVEVTREGRVYSGVVRRMDASQSPGHAAYAVLVEVQTILPEGEEEVVRVTEGHKDRFIEAWLTECRVLPSL